MSEENIRAGRVAHHGLETAFRDLEQVDLPAMAAGRSARIAVRRPTLKEEEVHLNDYRSFQEADQQIG